MNKLQKLQAAFRDKMKRLKEIRELEGDALTAEIRTERDGIIADVDQLTSDIDAEKRAIELDALDVPNDDDLRGGDLQITIDDAPIYRGSAAAALGQQMVDIAAVTNPNGVRGVPRKDAEKRLEDNTNRALALIEKSQGERVSKDFEKNSLTPVHNRDKRAAGSGQIQGIGSEGGFLLQSESSIDLMTHGFNNSEVLKRCQKRTITGSESLEIVGIDEVSRADGSRGGGIRVYTDAELSLIVASETKFEKIKVAPERLTGMYYASDKILKNATFLGQEMDTLFREEFAFKTQDLVMEGTGAGQAMGIKVSDCKIDIPKETDQQADTIVSENVLKMFERFLLRGNDAAVAWFANRNCFTQLFKMTHDVGTGGEMARMFLPARRPGEQGSMMGFPVIFIEQAETLGDAGDIWLTDFSQYVVVDYGDINEASSIHFKFDYGETTFRYIYYFDGQPRLVAPITPFKNSSAGSTISPFIRVAAR